MKKKRILIIGAGPAGLSAAIELAKASQNVLVIDKGKKGQIDSQGKVKLCGGGLTERGQALLAPLKSPVCEHKHLVIKTRYATAQMRFEKSSISTINRDLLGKELAERAIAAGADIKFETNVEKVDLKKKVILTDKLGELAFDSLIGADGALSIVRKTLVEAGEIKQTPLFMQAIEYVVPKDAVDRPITFDYDYRRFGGGYAWIFPHTDHCNIGACEIITSRRKKQPILTDLKGWAKEEGLPFDQTAVRGWMIPIGYQGHAFKNDVYLAGDAAGFTEGLFAEGISPAFLSGHDVAHLILGSNYRPVNIESILKIKKNRERLISLGDRLPLFRSIVTNCVIWIVGRNWLRNAFVKVAGLRY